MIIIQVDADRINMRKKIYKFEIYLIISGGN